MLSMSASFLLTEGIYKPTRDCVEPRMIHRCLTLKSQIFSLCIETDCPEMQGCPQVLPPMKKSMGQTRGNKVRKVRMSLPLTPAVIWSLEAMGDSCQAGPVSVYQAVSHLGLAKWKGSFPKHVKPDLEFQSSQSLSFLTSALWSCLGSSADCTDFKVKSWIILTVVKGDKMRA